MMGPSLAIGGSGGTPGAPGKSAYQIAVDNGFVGTVEQWLESLEGTDGASAYVVAVAEGFVGSQTEWVASLKGEPGDPGEPGTNGKSVELQKSATAILWRQEGGEFADLVTLEEITGPPGSGGGEGTVASVNGQTGPDVVLDAEDVGAATAADLTALSGLLSDLETALTAIDTEVDGKQDANVSLAAIAAFSTSGSLQSRTARLNFPTSGGGAVYAFGRNGRNNGGQMQGLQVGGGVESDGTHGVYMAPDGHSSWMRLQPSRNYSAIEEVIYATAAQGFASKVNGTNTFTITSGSGGDAANWVGEKFYWESETYRVSAVSGNTISVTTTSGGAVTLSGTASGVFHVFYVEATGTCTVSGSTVTRVSGDPFLPFITDPTHRLQIGGVAKTVTAFASIDSLTISSPPSAGAYTYRQRMDVDDTMVQFRLQKFFGDYEENLTFGAKPWGYFIRTQGQTAAGYRPLWIGSGEDRAQLGLMANGSLRIGDHGRIRAPNTSTYNYLDANGAPTGFAPNIRGRGPDANVGVGIDTQGDGEINLTVNNFSRSVMKASTGGIGFNGQGPVMPPSIGPAASTAAATTTLVNNIRATLIACGLATA